MKVTWLIFGPVTQEITEGRLYPMHVFSEWFFSRKKNGISPVFMSRSLDNLCKNATILCNIFGDQAKLGKIRKFCYIFLHTFGVLMPKNYFCRGDWTIGCVPMQFWDFSEIFLRSFILTHLATRVTTCN